MQLTTSWQIVSSDGFYDPSHYSQALEARYTSQSIEGNYTDIEIRVVNYTSSASYTWRTQSGTVNFTGEYNDSESCATYPDYVTYGQVMLSRSKRVYHNNDGTKSISLGAHLDAVIGGTRYNSNPPQTTVTMPKIDRYPMINTADNFGDEDNPVITYTTVLGFSGATVQACIASSDGNTVLVPYRDVDVPSGRYVFELTNQERTTLRQATPNSNKLTIRFYLKTTTTGGTEYFSYSTKEMTIVNNTPTFTKSYLETDTKVSQYFGSSANTIIKNKSKVKVTVVPSAKKEATISNVQVIYDGNINLLTTSPYETILNITDETSYQIIVTDSRGNQTSINDRIITFDSSIDYKSVSLTKLTFERENQTSSNIILNVESVFYEIDLNGTTNTPTLKWKIDNGNYTTLSSSDYVIDTQNNKITVTNLELSNALVYTSAGTFEFYIEDLLSNTSDTRDVIKGIPVFDYGEHDLQVNGELYIADTNRENAKEIRNLIYPVGSIYLSVNSTNPSTLFGGTWEAFATGRTLVGIDTSQTEFNSVEKTGGSKYLQEHGHNSINFVDGYSDGHSGQGTYKTLLAGPYASSVVQAVRNAGTGNSGNLQPYVVVYMWRRTA